MGIVALDEDIDGLTDLLEVAEDPTVDGLFLEGAVEAFGHTVGLGLGDEGKARRDAPKADLIEEVIGGVLGAMPDRQAISSPTAILLLGRATQLLTPSLSTRA